MWILQNIAHTRARARARVRVHTYWINLYSILCDIEYTVCNTIIVQQFLSKRPLCKASFSLSVPLSKFLSSVTFRFLRSKINANVLFTSIFLKEWKYGDGKKIRVRDYCRFWFYYTQNMKKSRFPKSVCVCVDFFSMANDNCRKFKQNQIIFCIQPWFVEVEYSLSLIHI